MSLFPIDLLCLMWESFCILEKALTYNGDYAQKEKGSHSEIRCFDFDDLEWKILLLLVVCVAGGEG